MTAHDGHGPGDGHGMGGMHEMHEMMMGGGMDGMMGGGMAAWVLLWSLVGLAVLVLAIVATVWLIRRMGTQHQSDSQHGAEDVLRRRYAAGEIDDEEFHRRLAVLSHRDS